MSEGPGTDPQGADVPMSSDATEVAEAETEAAPKPSTRMGFRSARAPSWPFLIALLLGILGAIVFMLSASALFVFGVGVAIAFFLVPVVNWIERKGLARWIAAILAVVVTMIVLISLIGITALIILDQGIAFIENLPAIIEELEEWYASLALPDWLRAGIDSILLTVEDNLRALDQGALVAGFIGGAISLLGGMFAWFLLPFFLFYLLKDQPRMSANFYARVPAPWKDDVNKILTISVGNFAQYFKAEFVVGGIMFLTVSIGMFAIGTFMDAPLLVKFALLLGLIAFVMELIPQIGPILSYIPALLLAIPAGLEVIIVVSAFYFIIFNIEGSILVPNLEGKMIDFSGASVLVLIAIGFALAGIIGAILALPLASIIRDLFRHFFDKAIEDSLELEPLV
ncbi:MAG: AI-2E family transporter, partial [Chloroflexota bacterium]|nr:AI-2E family transporter [Chloroflexota bacterium]